MKNILYNFLLINLLIFVVSCSTSNEVSQNSRIQKRRYTKGFYITFFNRNDKKQSTSSEIVENELKIEDEYLRTAENTFASAENNFVFQENQINTLKFEKRQIQIENYIESSSDLKKYNIITKQEELKINENVNWLKEESIKNIDYNRLKAYKPKLSRKLNDEQIIFILLLILAFILPPLSVLLFTNIDWKKVLIATLLTCLWWGPGILYAILVLLEIL